MTRPGRLRTVLALVLSTAALGSLAPPAAAASPRMGLSLDGTRWSDEIRQPLFDPGDHWVPGDRHGVRFWVRNTSGELVRLKVAVLGATGSLRLGRDVMITTEIDGAPSRGTSSRSVSTDDRLATSTRQVTVTAHIPATAGNEIQGRSLSPTIVVTLTQRPAVGTGRLRHDPPGHDGLAATGALVDPVLLAGLAALLTGGGAGVVLARRRRPGERS